MEHSVLAPSASEIWINCPGSIAMSQPIPDEETEESREGTAVHWLAESTLTTSAFVLADAVGVTAPNGVVITEEMVDAALLYVQEVYSYDGDLYVEQRVEMPEIHQQCFGTPDAWRFNGQQLRLSIFDLKYGHSAVEAFENTQLISYALGILKLHTNNQPLSELFNIVVDLIVVQPRCYDGSGQIKKWTINSVDLRPHVNRLHNAAHEAMGANPQIHAGLHCKNCKAKHVCPSLLKAAADAADYAANVAHVQLSPEAMAYEIEVLTRAAELIKYRKEALETEAITRIQAGEPIPGLMVEHGMSNNKWLKSTEEVITMCDLLEVDVRKPVEPLTPTQAIAKFKKAGLDPEIIQAFYGRTPTSAKLKLDNNSKARQLFSQEKI